MVKNIPSNYKNNYKNMAKEKCVHKNIIITIKEKYIIPNGYFSEVEKDDCDLGKYFIETDQTSLIFCEDCGEYLEE